MTKQDIVGAKSATEGALKVKPTNFASIRPVIGVASYQEAVDFYVDWLGFKIEWEWREAPGEPVVMQINRDGVAIQLLEGDEHPAQTWIQILVDDIVGLADELNLKRPNSAELADNFPYVRQISAHDPFGNLIVFEQPVTADEQREMDRRAVKMRTYIRDRLAAGHRCPTPEEVSAALGETPTFSTNAHASDILFEFSEYA